MEAPQKLLDQYKQYEFVINTNKKKLVKELFPGGATGEEKASLEVLREQIGHFDRAHYEILNLSNDIVDYPLFRVMTANMKTSLAE